MLGKENVHLLTPDLINSIVCQSVAPEDVRKLKLGLRLLGFKSIGHWVLNSIPEVMELESTPMGYKTGAFRKHLERRLRRALIPFNWIGRVRYFLGGVLAYKHFDEIGFQMYVYNASSDDLELQMAAEQMLINITRISSVTGDYELLNRIQRYNSKRAQANKQQEELYLKDALNKGFRFTSSMTKAQIESLGLVLSHPKIGAIDEENIEALLFVFSHYKFDTDTLEFPIKWNKRASDLALVYFLLIELKVLDGREINYADKLSSNFVDTDGVPLSSKAISKAAERFAGRKILDVIDKRKKGKQRLIFLYNSIVEIFDASKCRN